MKNVRRTKKLFILSLVLVVLIAGFIGYLFGNHNFKLSKNYVPKFVNRDLGKPNDVDFELFWQAYDKLKKNYLGTIDPQKFLYSAISGSFASTGDPYTDFLPPEVSKEFESELSGQLEGIGVKIGVLDGVPSVIAPIQNSPAQKAGLKPKDRIIQINGEDTLNMSLDAAVAKIRGEKGTKVKLTILREGEDKTQTFEIERAAINVKTVEVTYKDDVAIIELNEFGVETKPEFSKAADEIKQKNISKVVLDLRNNPGGLLDGAVDVAGELFPKGTTIVFEQGKSNKKEYKTDGKETLKDARLTVLVNGGSASAAEILAGAIQDNGRGKIIGEKTFGKGTVQQYEPLDNGSSVKITVAKWLTPKGNNIDKNGITPDFEIKEPDNALFSDNNPLLQKALEELK